MTGIDCLMTSSIFSAVEMAPRDPIIGLNELFNADTRSIIPNGSLGSTHSLDSTSDSGAAAAAADDARGLGGSSAASRSAQDKTRPSAGRSSLPTTAASGKDAACPIVSSIRR